MKVVTHLHKTYKKVISKTFTWCIYHTFDKIAKKKKKIALLEAFKDK